MPRQTLDDVLSYVVESGVSSIELMAAPSEVYARAPRKDNTALKEWRENASMDLYKQIKQKFEKKCVKIHILKFGGKIHDWSDEELEYAFNTCKTVGAKGLSMEISEEAAKKLAPIAEKHNLYLVFHNHLQPGDPNFSFEKHLEYRPNIMLNFDAGHYYGATGKDPKLLIEKLHNRILSIHIKDKTGPDASSPNTNMSFGEGETDVTGILQLVRDNNWDIHCDIELEHEIPEGSNAVNEVIKCFEYCYNALKRKK